MVSLQLGRAASFIRLFCVTWGVFGALVGRIKDRNKPLSKEQQVNRGQFKSCAKLEKDNDALVGWHGTDLFQTLSDG
ncbi:MAG: hypothetical protein ACR2N1_03455, partial [Rubripirellula sp.]